MKEIIELFKCASSLVINQKIEKDAEEGKINALFNEIRYNVNILSELLGKKDFNREDIDVIRKICSLLLIKTYRTYNELGVNLSKYDSKFEKVNYNTTKNKKSFSNAIDLFYQRIIVIQTISQNYKIFGEKINYKTRLSNLKRNGLSILNSYNNKKEKNKND